MQTGKMDLANNFNENLIELVRKRNCLYNKHSKSYFDNNLKNAAWMDIANKLNRSPEDCKTRWKHLRETFVKKNKRKLLGSCTEEGTWPYFKGMSFLATFVTPRRTKRNKRITKKQSVQSSDDELLEEQKEEPSTNNSERGHSVSSPAPESAPPKYKRIREPTLKTTEVRTEVSDPPDSGIEAIVEYFNMRQQEQASANNDHIYSFFKAMADSVVNLHPELQLNVKQQIFAIVSEAEYENIRPKPSTSSNKRATHVRSTQERQGADTSGQYNLLCEKLLQASEYIEKEDDCV